MKPERRSSGSTRAAVGWAARSHTRSAAKMTILVPSFIDNGIVGGHWLNLGVTMADAPDRPNTAHWPPIIYAATLVIAWTMQRVWPLPSLVPQTVAMIAWLILFVGLDIGVVALVHFRRVGTPFDPTAPARVLATGGIYRYSRNPMYLAAIICLIAIGLIAHWTWLILFVPVALMALIKLAIEREEAYLDRRFGGDYLAYRARVRRWI